MYTNYDFFVIRDDVKIVRNPETGEPVAWDQGVVHQEYATLDSGRGLWEVQSGQYNQVRGTGDCCYRSRGALKRYLEKNSGERTYSTEAKALKALAEMQEAKEIEIDSKCDAYTYARS
jgi:hypothetical protein